MRAQVDPLWMAAALTLGGLLAIQTVRLWWRSAGPRLRRWRRQSRALAGEQAAAGLLTSLGYRVERAQADGQWSIEVDGAPVEVAMRADYVVSRGARRYVAEVKTGDSAPSLRTAATRRQLLEYRLAYPVDGVLLVDMERGAVHEVDFPLPDDLHGSARPRWQVLRVAIVAGLLGYALGAYGSGGGAVSAKAGSSKVGSPASGGSGTSTSSRP